MSRFLVLAMPRSRSFWVSRFLSYEGREVAHDPARFFSGLADYDICGDAVDTALGYFWPWRDDPEGTRVAVLYRSSSEVVESLMERGVPASLPAIRALERRLLALPYPRFTFEGLNEESECSRLFEYCLQRPFDRPRWLAMKDENLQCDPAAYIRDVRANIAGIRNMVTHADS